MGLRILLGIRLGLAGLFLVAGLAKLVGHPAMVSLFEALEAPWLRWAVGTWEVLAALGLLAERTAGTAAGSLALLMVGAMAVHFFVLPTPSIVPALVALVLALVVVYARIGRLGQAVGDTPRIPRAL